MSEEYACTPCLIGEHWRCCTGSCDCVEGECGLVETSRSDLKKRINEDLRLRLSSRTKALIIAERDAEDAGWYCSSACWTNWNVDRERDKPLRRLSWLRNCWGVNVWSIAHHITAENLPSGYGRA